MSEDKDLLGRAIAGDKLAIKQIIERCQPWVKDVCCARFSCKDTVADLTQIVLERVIQNLPKYKRGESFRAWVKTITRNKCTDYYRKYKRRARILKDHAREIGDNNHAVSNHPPRDILDQEVEQEERARILRESLDCLKQEQREVFVLRLEGLKYKAIAKQLGITEVCARGRYHQAKLVITENLRQRGTPEMRRKIDAVLRRSKRRRAAVPAKQDKALPFSCSTRTENNEEIER